MTGFSLQAFDKAAFFSLLALVAFVPISSSLSEIFTVLTIVLWGLSLRLEGVKDLYSKLPVYAWGMFGAFLFWAVLSSLLSAQPVASLSAFVTKWLEWLCLPLIALSVLSTDKRLRLFFGVILAVSFLMAADGFWQFLFLKDFLRGRELSAGMYPTASFSYYTLYAGYASIVFFAGIGAAFSENLPRLARALLILHHTIFLTLIILTFSRGAWIGVSVGFLSFALMREKKLIMPAAFCVAVIFFLCWKQLSFRVFPFSFFSPGDYRFEIWHSTFRIIQTHPWWGIGINQYQTIIGAYSSSAGYAHNSYLQIAAETGIAGIVFFAGWVLSVLAYAFKSLLSAGGNLQRGLGIGVFSGLIAFMTHSFFDNFFFNNALAMFFWTLFGALAAIMVCDRQAAEVKAC